MTPEVERFLDLATRPLEAVPGEREEAKGELMSRIAHDGLPYELLDLAEPLERLEKAKPGSRAPRRGILLSGMLLLTAAASVGVGTMARDVYLMFEAARMSFQVLGLVMTSLGNMQPSQQMWRKFLVSWPFSFLSQ